MTAWACAADYISEIEDRRTNDFGLNAVLGVVVGEPVYTPSELQAHGLLTLSESQSLSPEIRLAPARACQAKRIPNPQRRTWSTSKPDVLLSILELPHVTAEEIRAAGFDPEWGPEVSAISATP